MPALLIPAMVLLLVAPVLAAGDANADANLMRMLRQGRAAALTAGLLRGICAVQVIRPDLLAVTIDGGVVGAWDANQGDEARQTLGGAIDEWMQPQAWRIVCDEDPAFAAGAMPSAVERATYDWHNCLDTKKRWDLARTVIVRHDMYLRLPRPLSHGRTYTIATTRAVGGPGVVDRVDLAYAQSTPTPVIKVNQGGYAGGDGPRWAYLGWWAGGFGAVDYGDLTRFRVVPAGGGGPVLEGDIVLRRRSDANSGEHIHELDLARLAPGSWRIEIPGFASSDVFHVGGTPVLETAYHALRAFLHQRCGQELGPPWSAAQKPACHVATCASGKHVAGTGSDLDAHGHPASAAGQRQDGEEVRSMRGGWHDAADFDTFAYHLPAAMQLMTLHERFPTAFPDGRLNLPESGNGVPDLLDEAEWGLAWWLEHQLPSGAVPLGRSNLQDSVRQQIVGGRQAPVPPFGILPPAAGSTPTFAAAAAQFARVIRPHDTAKAERYLAAARRAYAYASASGAVACWQEHTTPALPLVHPGTKDGVVDEGRTRGVEQDWRSWTVAAAAELLKTTREPAFAEAVARRLDDVGYWSNFAVKAYAVASCEAELLGAQPAARARTLLLDGPLGARRLVAATAQAGYRMGNGDGTACGWGSCQGANHGATLLLGWFLTGEAELLAAARLNADWHLGANPLSKSLMTSTGVRFPNRPEISWFLYADHSDGDLRGPTIRGISIYGIGPPLRSHPGKPKGQGEGWPLWRSWRDVWGNFAEIYSEFTVPQTLGPAALLHGTLYALEVEAGRVAPQTPPRFPLGAIDR